MVISPLALLALPLHHYILYFKEHNMAISPLALCCQSIYTHMMLGISPLALCCPSLSITTLWHTSIYIWSLAY